MPFDNSNSNMTADELLLLACERAAPWIAKLIADGGHLACAAPHDAVRTLELIEAAISARRSQVQS